MNWQQRQPKRVGHSQTLQSWQLISGAKPMLFRIWTRKKMKPQLGTCMSACHTKYGHGMPNRIGSVANAGKQKLPTAVHQ
mmetsp:Transcript_62512/g.116213  ORF Transcript_62512/g.116213 Transcript_62512/m.116213 type:complete len:80 (+) Transcript_62512:222-461(+)